MNAVVCHSPGELRLVQKADPVPQPGHAILKIRRVGICGTDIHAFGGTQPYFTYPRILGHELAGELIDTGGMGHLKQGELYTVVPYLNCGNCVACRRGRTNCCVNMKVLGVHVDGGMVEYLSVPCTSLVPGNGLTLDELAMVEPLAIGAHSVSRASIDAEEWVLVVGAGPIGIGIVQFAKLAGANVIVMDVDDRRLDFCKAIANHVVNPSREDAMERIREITNLEMPTAIFDATGNRQAINGSLAYLAHSGRYILVGLQKGDLNFSHPEFHKRETTLMSSRNALIQDFGYVVSCIHNRLIDPASLITRRVQFNDLDVDFKEIVSSKTPIIKAIVDVAEAVKQQKINSTLSCL